MAYQKQTWRDFDDTKTDLQNINNGAVVTPERLNHIENGIANSADKAEVTAQLQQTLKQGEVSVSDINKNLGLLDETYLSDTLKAQMAGTTAIGSTPPDKSITPTKATFFETGKNKLNPRTVKEGYFVDHTTGALTANVAHAVYENVIVSPNTDYVLSGGNLIGDGARIVFKDENKNYISGTNNFLLTIPFKTPVNARYVDISSTPINNVYTLQLEKGTVATPFETYYEKIPTKFLSIPEPPAFATPMLGFGGTMDIKTNPVFADGADTRIDFTPIQFSGDVRSVSFRATKLGLIKIKFFELIGTTISFKKEVVLSALAGFKTYDLETPLSVKSGWLVGFYSELDGPKVSYEPTGETPNSFAFQNQDVQSDKSTIGVTNNYKIAISVAVENTVESLNDRLRVLEIEDTSAEPKKLMLSETFMGTTLPDNFINSGFLLNNGAKSPSVGGLDKQIYWNIESTVDTGVVRLWISPHDDRPDVAVLRKSWYSAGLAGLFRLDGVNKKLIMYAPWTHNTNTLPDVAIEKSMTLPIVPERKYLMEVVRDTVRYHTFRITDTITGQSEEVTNDYVSTRKFSIGHGYTGVVAFGGDFTINRLDCASHEPAKPRLALYGDSFIEASTLLLDGGLDKRYASLLKTKLDGSIHINGRGGEASTQLVSKIKSDFSSVTADYTVLAIGTNDSDFNLLQSNIIKLIEVIESKGSIPILMTLTKITAFDRTAFMNAVNQWIINSGYLYVDANLATTLNNDRITQNTTMFFADGVHPNTTGHEAIYNRFLLDVPEVFDGF